MKAEKSTSGLPFLATVVLLIVVIFLLFVSYTCVPGITGDCDNTNRTDDSYQVKFDIVFFKELKILLEAIILTIAAVFTLLFLRRKRII